MEEFVYRPGTYADAVGQLATRLGLSAECAEELRALARLRNLLVHRYWRVDDRKIYEDVKRNFTCVEAVLRAVVERYD